MNSPIGWPGGKRALVKRILALLPQHKTYVEPFCGSAKLLFSKEPSEHEVISDTNGDLINFFLVAKYRPAALAAQFSSAIAHPQWFRELRRSSQPAHEDEVTRAFRFAYLNVCSFGAKGEHFAKPAPERAARRVLSLIPKQLAKVSGRLGRVGIEQSEYAEVVEKYDSAQTLFYCDPPYVDFASNGRYKPFSAEQFEKMFTQLAAIKGKFLMSMEDAPLVLATIRGREFCVKRIETVYTLAAKSAKKRVELLISNFQLKSPATALLHR